MYCKTKYNLHEDQGSFHSNLLSEGSLFLIYVRYLQNEREVFIMKRIKAACITQTLCFSSRDGESSEYAKKAIVQEYEKYKAQLEKSGTKYRLISEETNEDGSITIEIKKQYNTSPVGEYLN